MKWSLRIARIAGIDVYLHVTFLLLVAFLLLSNVYGGKTVAQALLDLAFVLSLFACVLLHELGHALAARQFHIRTRDITLLPIGGLARLERMPDKPLQELWVAIAGPLVNVVIATALWAGLVLRGGDFALATDGLMRGTFPERLLWVNVAMVVFNMLPAFPMDGGRVVRALLATVLDFSAATQIAAYLGQGMAILFGLVGLLAGNPMLMFIALFVWIGAAQEAGLAQMRTSLGGVPVRHAMLTDFRVLGPGEPLSRAVDLLLQGSQQDFPIVDDGRVVGVLLRSDVLAELARNGPASLISDVMRTRFETADMGEMLEDAFERLQQCECRAMPVFYRGQLVGLLTTDNVGEFLMIQSALGRRGARPVVARPVVAAQ